MSWCWCHFLNKMCHVILAGNKVRAQIADWRSVHSTSPLAPRSPRPSYPFLIEYVVHPSQSPFQDRATPTLTAPRQYEVDLHNKFTRVSKYVNAMLHPV